MRRFSHLQLTGSLFVASGLTFGLITFFVNPKTAGVAGITIWLALLGVLVFAGANLIINQFLPQVERKILLSFLVSLTLIVAAALSSVQQLSLSDFILITLIDAVVYYAAVRL